MNFTALAALGALMIATAVGLCADRIGRALGLLDWPDPAGGRKLHRKVTPLVGGVGVMPGVLAGGLVAWVALGGPVGPGPGPSPEAGIGAHLPWFLGVAGLLFVIGMADDRLGLGPRLRLLASLAVFFLLVLYAPDFRVSFLLFTSGPTLFLGGTLAILFSLVCLVGLLNAVNMADGKNGLVISLSILWTTILWIEAPQPLDPLFAALMAGLIVMLYFNMRDRLFLGDGGSYGLSAVMGMLAIYAYNQNFENFRADRLALLFVIPVIDTIRLITTRSLKGRSPFQADRDHLHHHIAFRWGWPRGLIIYLGLVAIPNLLAYAYPSLAPAMLALTLPAYIAILVLSTRRTAFVGDIVPQPMAAGLPANDAAATSAPGNWGVAKR